MIPANILPTIIKIIKVIQKYYALLPSDIIKAFYGLSMCFFGGTFQLSLAAHEAFIGPGYQ